MQFPNFFQALPKVASVIGGLCLLIGIPIFGFAFLTGSALLNLFSAIKARKRSDIGFFSAWAFFNSWFSLHSGGH